MKKLPMYKSLSHEEKNSLIEKLWEENQRLEAENKVLKGKTSDNVKKTSKNSSIPPSQEQKANKTTSKSQTRKTRKEGNNGRNLEPNPTQTVIARAKTCLW